MPRVPKYNIGSVRENAGPSGNFSANASGKSFSNPANEALSVLGNAAEKIGGALFQRGLQEDRRSEQLKNRGLAGDAYQQDMRQVLDLEAELGQKEGKDSLDISAEYTKRVDEMKKARLSTLESEEAKELYRASFDNLSNQYFGKVHSRQEKNREVFNRQSMDAENLQYIEHAKRNYNDKGAIAEAEATITANTNAIDKNLVDDAVNNLHSEVLSAMSKDSMESARNYLIENYDKFDPKVREKLKADLTEKAAIEKDYAKGEELSAMPLDKALAAIDKIKNPESANRIRKIVKDAYTEKEDLKQIKHKERLESEVDAVFKNPGAYKVPLELQAKDQEHLYSLKQRMMQDARAKRGVGTAVKTDPKTYYELMNMPGEDFKKLNLVEYSGKLSIGDFKAMTKMQKKDEDFANAQNLTTFVSKFAKSEASDDFEQASFVQGMFEAELNKYPVNERNKIETWNKIKDQMVLEMDVSNSFFSWGDEKYWKAKHEGREIIEPADRPENIPDKAAWVDKSINGKTYRGYEYTNNSGQTYLYVDGKPYFVKRKNKVAGR